MKRADVFGHVIPIVGEVEEAHAGGTLLVGEHRGGVELLVSGAEIGLCPASVGGFAGHGAVRHFEIERGFLSGFDTGFGDVVVLPGEVAVRQIDHVDACCGEGGKIDALFRTDFRIRRYPDAKVTPGKVAGGGGSIEHLANPDHESCGDLLPFRERKHIFETNERVAAVRPAKECGDGDGL